MILRLVAASLLAGWLAGCSASDPPTCRIGRVVDLPLVAGGQLPAVEASLDGQKVLIYIDTGAFVSLITRQAAEHFNLRPGPEAGLVRISGINGTVNAPLVKVPHLVLGQGIARDLELPVAGDLGGPVQGTPVLGLFGADFLASYDVDLDLPGHHFAMYRLQSCGTRMHPLADPAFSMPFEFTDSKVVLGLKLNGKPVSAVLDSGAMQTLVPADLARQAGVAAPDMQADRSARLHGIDERALAARLHRFGTLDIGDETMRSFRFSVADADTMLLGDDFLRFNQVWISYPLQLLYVRPVLPAALAQRGQ